MSHIGTRIGNGYEVLRKQDRLGNLIFLHVLIAEKALGKPLPMGAVVHHANENRADNRPGNLVICPGRGYHEFLHQRLDAWKACGNPSWRKCPFCKRHDAPANLYIYKSSGQGMHRKCANEYERNARRRS